MPSRTKSPKPRRTKAFRERVARVLDELHRLYPDVDCALDFRDPYELLVATILSAQCTDETVNRVTPALFRRYPRPQALARAEVEAVERLIYSTGFYRNKARNLCGLGKRLVAAYGGEVPRTMDELLTLPGVARKTANVVLGTAFGLAEGIVVDTHVGRLARRLDLSRETDPVKVERELMTLVPRADWIWLSHALITHGRRVCAARRPRCGECSLAPDCPSRDREAGA